MRKLISLDWLSFSFNLSLTKEEYISGVFRLNEPKGYFLEQLSGTNVFNNRCVVRDLDGRKVLTLLYSPKSAIIPKRMCLCEIANVCLYSDEWKKIFYLIPLIHAGEYNHLTRLDIACDFDSIGDDVAKMFDNGEIYVQRKKEGCSFYDYKENSGLVFRKVKQFSFGSKTSKLKWKLYNKSLELSVSDKEYIRKTWAENMLDLSSNIWRLEVSIVRCSSLQCLDRNDIDLLDLTEFFNHESYFRLFPHFYKRNFVVRKNQGRAGNKINPNDVFDFLQFDDKEDLSLTVRLSDLVKYADGEILTVFNHLVNDLQRSCIRYNFAVAEQTLSVIQNLMKTFYLEDYLYNVHGFLLEDLVKMVDNPKIFDNYGK